MLCQEIEKINSTATQIEKELENCKDTELKRKILKLVDSLYESSDNISNEHDCES